MILMAKLSKEDFLKKIDETEMSDDVKISFMEDISDSLEDANQELLSEIESLKSELESKVKEIEDLNRRYKERFLSTEEVKEEIKDDTDADIYEEKSDEEEVIDVKEI